MGRLLLRRRRGVDLEVGCVRLINLSVDGVGY